LGGRRLLLGVTGYLSYHMRANLFQQSKGSSDPALPEPEAGPVTSNPFSSLAWDYAGPIAENIGIWTEWYSTNFNPSRRAPAASAISSARSGTTSLTSAWASIPASGGNIVSVFINNQGQSTPFFAAFGSGTPAGGQGQFITIGVAGWLKDRVAVQLVVGPGADNLDYKRMNYGAVLAVMPMNTDGMWLMPTWSVMVGNDNTPTAGGIAGVSALSKGGAGYTSQSMGDYNRNLLDVRWGFLDHGHWSINSATGFSWNKETTTTALAAR
jgi:hypothetical protein